jgi:hypothetical protein
VLGGALGGEIVGNVLFYNWDQYGRRANDRYWKVGGYELTYRLSPDQGHALIYYSGFNQSMPTIPYWIR